MVYPYKVKYNGEYYDAGVNVPEPEKEPKKEPEKEPSEPAKSKRKAKE